MSVVQFSQAPGEVELVSAKLADVIKSPADFKGRALGVTGLGSSTNFLTQYLAVAHGVKVSEITPVPVGAGTTFIAAMKQGRIDAGMTTEPTISRLLASGDAKMLVDLRTPASTEKALGGTLSGGLSLHAHCLGQRSSCAGAETRQCPCQNHAFHRHASAPTKSLPRCLPTTTAGDRASYVQALANSKRCSLRMARCRESGPATVLKVLQGFDKEVQGKVIDLSKTFTNEFSRGCEMYGGARP